jgi:hypothetical protein
LKTPAGTRNYKDMENHEHSRVVELGAERLQALLLSDAVMTAYSITGSLSAATTLCSDLVDAELPHQYQAAAVLSKLHSIAMSRPKH